ncbi:hypothetical protein F5Y11DRAFT_335733 [Daldinia sp. FL1419]|nr:hypothetical protein F5Y11DRAFT_335733 [Daldinia sp. FL1419]
MLTLSSSFTAAAALLGGRWDRIILPGLSMGGATCAHVLFNLDIPPGSGRETRRLHWFFV